MTESPQSSSATFGLGALFELVAGVALFLALVTQLEWHAGLLLAVLGLLIVLSVHRRLFPSDRGGVDLGGCLSGLLIMLLLGILLLPAFPHAGESSRRAQCRNNLRQLALAFDLYRETYGHYPPPYIADADGKPMHSWRVLILPFIEERSLFDAYDMKEPWDGPHNSQLVAQMPQAFRCPSDGQMPPGMTSYFCITGTGRAKTGQAKLRSQDIADGADKTIALVESSSARVNWLEPRDLTVDDALAGENTAEAPCPCSLHGRIDHGIRRSASQGFNAAMFDVTAHQFAADLDPDTLRAMLTIDGGETIDPAAIEAIPSSSGGSYVWPGVWVLLGVELAFIVFAIIRRVRLARRIERGVAHG